MALILAETDAEIAACFPALLELRPHLQEVEFVARVRRQQSQGYHLAYVHDEHGRVVSVCGFRVEERLTCGTLMYIDDLVTVADARGRGYGGMLLDAAVAQARLLGCAQLQLDSGFQRHDAHRLYLDHGFKLTSHHFALEL